MNQIISNPNPSGDKINRYNDSVYVKYTHCEFHPSMMLGTASGSIPFCEHNQAPRNIYNFSQAKQNRVYLQLMKDIEWILAIDCQIQVFL